MACNYKFACRSDTAFRCEEDKEGLVGGRSARGANFLRLGLDTNQRDVGYLIDVWYCQASAAETLVGSKNSKVMADAEGVPQLMDEAGVDLHDIFIICKKALAHVAVEVVIRV